MAFLSILRLLLSFLHLDEGPPSEFFMSFAYPAFCLGEHGHSWDHYHLCTDDFQIWFRCWVEFPFSYSLPEASASTYLVSKPTPHVLISYIFNISYLGNGSILPVIQERSLCSLQYDPHNLRSQLGVNFSWFLLFSSLFSVPAFTLLPPSLP